MNVRILSLLPIIYGAIPFFLCLLLLAKKGKKAATYALAAAALLQAFTACCLFFFVRTLPESLELTPLRMALLFASVSPVPLVIFSFTLVPAKSRTLNMVRKVTIPAVTIAGLAFAMISRGPFLLQEVALDSGNWILNFGPLGRAFSAYLILCVLLILFQMERIVRLAHSAMRRRLKFLVLGITVGCLYTLSLSTLLFFFRQLNLDLLLAGTLIYAVCWCMLAFAVFRHRLLDADLFISRHAVFASAIAFFGILYLFGTGVLGVYVQRVSGQWNLFWSVMFIGTSVILLILLLASATFQRRVKHFINVHFYRYKYDYRIEWRDFTQKLGTVEDLPNLLQKLIETVSESTWVNQVSIWLYNQRSHILSFSTSRNLPRKAGFLNRESPLVQYLLEHPEPLNVEEPRVQDIVDDHRELFDLFNIRVIVPLKKGERLVGMMTLGPNMKGTAFSDEDYELLTTIAQQAASAIFSSELIEEVALTKEAESFHKISSFLVHDLKNLVSSLSLVLQNAERNISKPEFQKDLLSTIMKTVEKMKVLIEKLSTLPKELEIKKTPIDINQHVREALESSKVKNLKGVILSTDLTDLPTIKADGDYLKKVLINLVLNSVQALPGGKGRIEVATFSRNGYVQIEVLDSGVGMTEEFLRKQLFKPFTSTKRKGLGIGLYQCKAIMEALGGNIEVSSIPNRGSQFILKLPIK